SNDEPGESISEDRPIIEMDPPANNDIDWNDVKLVWNEEFQATAKMDDIWDYETGDFSNPNMGDGIQVYRKENVELSGGTMKIFAKEKNGVYTSARLSGKK